MAAGHCFKFGRYVSLEEVAEVLLPDPASAR
jgi:hypothetical protein